MDIKAGSLEAEYKSEAKKLAGLLKLNPDYQQYIIYRQKIQSDSGLFEKINQFKREQLEIEIKRMQGLEIAQWEEQRLGNIYSELTLNHDAYHFFYYENKALVLLAGVCDSIAEEIDIDLRFLE